MCTCVFALETVDTAMYHYMLIFVSDLLSFMPPKVSSEPILYPRVDWFDHHESHDENSEKNKSSNKKTNKE